MTPRERVLAALDHREPDRVPIEFGVARDAVHDRRRPVRLRRAAGPAGHHGRRAPGARACLLQLRDQRGPAHPGALRGGPALGGRGRPGRRGATGRHAPFDPSWGFDLVPLGAINQADDAAAPLRHATTWDEIAAHPSWPDPADPRVTAGAADAGRVPPRRGLRGRRQPGGRLPRVPPLPAAARLRHLAVRHGRRPGALPPAVRTDPGARPRDHGAAACRRSPVHRPGVHGRRPGLPGRDACLPRRVSDASSSRTRRAWVAAARRLAPGARIAYHSCGSFREVLPDLIEIGVEVLTPVQPLARGMELHGA